MRLGVVFIAGQDRGYENACLWELLLNCIVLVISDPGIRDLIKSAAKIIPKLLERWNLPKRVLALQVGDWEWGQQLRKNKQVKET